MLMTVYVAMQSGYEPAKWLLHTSTFVLLFHRVLQREPANTAWENFYMQRNLHERSCL